MRWRAAMQGDVMPLTGIVEIDETFGGKARNMAPLIVVEKNKRPG